VILEVDCPPVGSLDIRPFVREAVEALGYFIPDRSDDLALLFVKMWREKSATMLFYGSAVGDDLTEGEKLAAGLTKARMPRSLWQILSDKGRLDPRHAAKATTLRMNFNVMRWRSIQMNEFEAEISSRIEFRGLGEYSCDACRPHMNKVIPRSARFPMPLPECTAEWCSCRWDMVMDDEQ
jgi:hypothetical protein